MSNTVARGILLTLLVLAGCTAFLSIRACHNQRELDYWRNQAAVRDELAEVSIGQWQRAAQSVRTSRQALRALEHDYNALADDLANARADLHAVTTVTVTAKPETLTTVITDTIVADVGVRRFQLTFEGATVRGEIDSNSTVRADILYTPIRIAVVASELPDGSYRGNLEVPPWVNVDAFSVTVVTHEPGGLMKWWLKARWWIVAGGSFYAGLRLGMEAGK